MKQFFLLLLLITGITARASDSLMLAQREEILFSYLNMKNTQTQENVANLKNLLAELERLIGADNTIVDSLKKRNQNIAELSSANKIMQTAVEKLETEKNQSLTSNKIFFYGGIGISVLALLLLVLLIRCASRISSCKKQLNEVSESTASEIEKFKDEIGLLQGRLTDRDILIKKIQKEKEELAADKQSKVQLSEERLKQEENLKAMQAEISKLRVSESLMLTAKLQKEGELKKAQDEIKRLEKELEDIRAGIHEKSQEIPAAVEIPHSEEFFRRAEEIELKMVKIEKLNHLYTKQILSIDEYLVLKQKILEEL